MSVEQGFAILGITDEVRNHFEQLAKYAETETVPLKEPLWTDIRRGIDYEKEDHAELERDSQQDQERR